MKLSTLSTLVFSSLALTGCQSLGDEWAKTASDSLLKMTGNSAYTTSTPPPNNSNYSNTPNNQSAPSPSFGYGAMFGAPGSSYPAETSTGSTNGVINLSGPDTAAVGTSLDTGYVGASKAAGTQPDYIVVVDRHSTVTANAQNMLVPNNTDPSNGFVLVVTDVEQAAGVKAISMSIVVGGVKHDYLCSTQPSSSMTHCGSNSIALDMNSQSVAFSNATVENADTKTILTLAGSLNW